MSPLAVLGFCTLLLLPAAACVRLAGAVNPWLVAGYAAGVSVFTLWLYWEDKRQAEADGWRTPESTLHLTELCGGWVAAFVAQRVFRHKISKTSYQIVYWAIVAAHQVLAFDYLNSWRFVRRLLLPGE